MTFEKNATAGSKVLCFLAICLLGLITVYLAVLGCLPPLARDELLHHLAIPSIWLEHGFKELPWAAFSYYPMNVDLLYLAPLALKADYLAHHIHLFLGLATAGLIWLSLRSQNRAAALWGALFFISLPAVQRLGISAYSDLGLCFFIAAALWMAFKWDGRSFNRWFFGSAAALGLALGTKYNGLLGLPFFAGAICWLAHRAGLSFWAGLGRAFIYCGLALMIFGPWPAKNWLLTGNPLYPLYNNLFGLPALSNESLSLDLFTIRARLYRETPLEIFTAPLRAFFQGRDHDPKYFDGTLNGALILLPLILLPGAWKAGRLPERAAEAAKTGPLLGAGLAIYWITAVFLTVDFRVRYMLPAVPPLVVLAALGLNRLARRSRIIAVLAGAAVLLPNFYYSLALWRELAPGAYLSGRENRDEFLARRLEYYPALAAINHNLSGQDRVLFLFAGSAGYYCQKPYYYHTMYNGEAVRPLLQPGATPEAVARELAARPTTYILLAKDRWRRYTEEIMTPAEKSLWEAFAAKYLWLAYEDDRGYEIYGLRRPTP